MNNKKNYPLRRLKKRSKTKIGKIGRIQNEKLIDRDMPGDHYAMISAHHANNIGLNAITSITDNNGNVKPNKARHLKNGLIKEIDFGNSNKKRSAININVETINKKTLQNFTLKDLMETNRQIDMNDLKHIMQFIYQNQNFPNRSLSNRKRVKQLKKRHQR